jgi:hypothetical protein
MDSRANNVKEIGSLGFRVDPRFATREELDRLLDQVTTLTMMLDADGKNTGDATISG